MCNVKIESYLFFLKHWRMNRFQGYLYHYLSWINLKKIIFFVKQGYISLVKWQYIMNERWPGTRKIWCYWHFHWSLWIFLLQSFPFTALSLQHISIFMVMVILSMTLKTYLHINLLCHSILSFFISSLSHLVQNPLLNAMEHLWQKALHKKLIETDLSLQSCLYLCWSMMMDGPLMTCPSARSLRK